MWSHGRRKNGALKSSRPRSRLIEYFIIKFRKKCQVKRFWKKRRKILEEESKDFETDYQPISTSWLQFFLITFRECFVWPTFQKSTVWRATLLERFAVDYKSFQEGSCGTTKYFQRKCKCVVRFFCYSLYYYDSAAVTSYTDHWAFPVLININ